MTIKSEWLIKIKIVTWKFFIIMFEMFSILISKTLQQFHYYSFYIQYNFFNDMNNDSNYEIRRVFTIKQSNDRQKTHIVFCDFCFFYNYKILHIIRMRDHLKTCENYLKNFKNKDFFIVIDIVLIRVKIECKNEKFFKKRIKTNQQTLNYFSYNDVQLDYINMLIIEIIVENELKLNLFENQNMRRFMKIIVFFWKSSCKKTIFIVLLDQIFEQNKQKMHRILDENFCFNFIIDDVFNINQKRIVNFIVQTFEYDFFLLISKNMSSFEHNAKKLIFRIVDKIFIWNDNKSKNVNFLCIDDAFVMRKIWRIIQTITMFQHVFFLICDNHDIQFLVKDIFELSWFVWNVMHWLN